MALRNGRAAGARALRAGVLPPTLLAAALALGTAGARETAVQIPAGEISLAGTLLVPEDAPPVAAAVIVAGSGPTDRDGNSPLLPGRNDALRLLADALQAAKVVSLRYDKRMIGASADPRLSEAELRFEHYADDLLAAGAFLRQRFDLPLFLVGHSEGGHLALLAALRGDVDGVVVIAGPGQHPADLIDQQLSRQLPPALLASSRAALERLRAGELAPEAPDALAVLFRPSVQPYLVSWFRYDPAEQAAALTVPLLLVYGSTDRQVPVDDGRRLARANPRAELVIVEGMNHVLKMVPDDPAAQQASYSDPELPLAPELAPAIAGFVRRVLGED